MDDSQTLLTMALKLHFRERPQILDGALRVIKDYLDKGPTLEEYEKILNELREKMNDLPEHILLYFLTLIPMPQQIDECYKSPLSDEISSKEYQTDRIRSQLLGYLNSRIPSLILLKKDGNVNSAMENSKDDKQGGSTKPTGSKTKTQFVRPKRIVQTKRRNVKNQQKGCESLLDLCAKYVVTNKDLLNRLYKHKKEKIWRMVNSNNHNKDQLAVLYDVLRYINKKAKLMRMIDCDEVPHEIIYEEYGNSDVFLKEKHLYVIANEDPFALLSAEQESIIQCLKM